MKRTGQGSESGDDTRDLSADGIGPFMASLGCGDGSRSDRLESHFTAWNSTQVGWGASGGLFSISRRGGMVGRTTIGLAGRCLARYAAFSHR